MCLLKQPVDDFGKELFHLLQSAFKRGHQCACSKKTVDGFCKELLYL